MSVVQIQETDLPGVLVVEPRVFGDSRGFFFESYNESKFAASGIRGPFVQQIGKRHASPVAIFHTTPIEGLLLSVSI